jgi:hypothetical protein
VADFCEVWTLAGFCYSRRILGWRSAGGLHRTDPVEVFAEPVPGAGVVERFADDVAVGGHLVLEGGRDERKCLLSSARGLMLRLVALIRSYHFASSSVENRARGAPVGARPGLCGAPEPCEPMAHRALDVRGIGALLRRRA